MYVRAQSHILIRPTTFLGQTAVLGRTVVLSLTVRPQQLAQHLGGLGLTAALPKLRLGPGCARLCDVCKIFVLLSESDYLNRSH